MDVESLPGNLGDDLAHTGLGLFLPSLASQFVPETWNALNDEEFFKRLVGLIVGHLGINGGLELMILVEPAVILLQNNHPVGEEARILGNLEKERLWGLSEKRKLGLRAIKKMIDVLEAGVGGQVDTVVLELGCSEAGQHQEVVALGHESGELDQDLGETITIPQRALPEHRRRNEEPDGGGLLGHLLDAGDEGGEHGLDPLADIVVLLGGRQEVSDASENTNVYFIF